MKVLQDPHEVCKAAGLGQRDTVILFRRAVGCFVLWFTAFGAGRTEQGGLNGSSATSTLVCLVMPLMAKEVVQWSEDPKPGKGGETFELPGDKKSVVNETEGVSDAAILAIWPCR